MTKKVVISGYYGFENFGDEAILNVLSNELKKNGFDVTVFSKNPQFTSSKLNVNSVYTFDIRTLVKTIKDTDVLFSGGGSLLQDVTSIKSLFYYLFVIATAIFFKKDVIIFAQGIGPINNIIGRLLTKILLKRCKYVTVRDKKSYSLLQKWGLNPDLVSDPVWNLQLPEYKPKNKIGIQLRSWHSLTDEYLKSLATSVNKNFATKEIVIYSFQDVLDIDTCLKFEKYLKETNPNIKTKVLNAMSIDDTSKSFSELQYVIAMRYHACLLALKYGIPTLALSYDEKVEKIAHRFNLPCSFLNAEENFANLIKDMLALNIQEIRENASSCYFSFQKIVDLLK